MDLLEYTVLLRGMADFLHTADLFMKVSSFTRHLLDDVLPNEVQSKGNEKWNIFEKLLEECDALFVSLNTFKLKVVNNEAKDFSPKSFTALTTKSSNAIKEEEPYKSFSDFCDLIRVKMLDIVNIKPRYCKPCKYATWKKKCFIAHLVDPQHSRQIVECNDTLSSFNCTICRLVLFAPQADITNMMLLPSHVELDRRTQKLEAANKKAVLKVNNQAESNSEVSSQTKMKNCSSVIQLPLTVEILLNDVKDCLKVGKKLNIEPHYCSVCDVIARSYKEFMIHASSMKHISVTNTSNESIDILKCETCGLLITGWQRSIELILSSELHREVDECVLVPMKKSDNYDEVRMKTGLTPVANPCKVTPTTPSATNTFMKLIKKIPEKFKLPSDAFSLVALLEKSSPCLCYICDRSFVTRNDFHTHQNSKKHLNAVKTRNDVNISTCPICRCSIFGTEIQIKLCFESVEHMTVHKTIESFIEYNIATKTVLSTVRATNSLGKIEEIETFLCMNFKLKNCDYSKCYFCAYCKKWLKLENGWPVHYVTCRRDALVGKIKSDVESKCNLCPLQIRGDVSIVQVYMDVHILANHPDSKQNNDPTVTNKVPGCSVEQKKLINESMPVGASQDYGNDLIVFDETDESKINIKKNSSCQAPLTPTEL